MLFLLQSLSLFHRPSACLSFPFCLKGNMRRLKARVLEISKSGFESWLFNLPAESLWVSFLISWILTFLICKMGVLIF